jgi:hypothetical protein
MATDPVRSIQRRAIGHAYDLSLDGAIAKLAALEPATDTPYLTVAIDWTPDGNRTLRSQGDATKRSQRRTAEPDISGLSRPARTELEKAATALAAEYEERSAARASVDADLERLFIYLDRELDPSAKGAIVVANHGLGVFETIVLAIPVETSLSADVTPQLRTLVRVAEDYEPYAVLHADQLNSTLYFFIQDQPFEELSVKSNDYPRKQATGGLNQRRYRNRADERVSAFARTVAAETHKTLDELGVESFFIAGDEVITSALDPEWPAETRAKLGGIVRVPIVASIEDLVSAVAPMEEARERQEELDAVAVVETALASGDLARSGAVAVIAALVGRQVDALVMNADFTAPGWIDYSLNIAGAGEIPAEHPGGGDVANIVAVDLGEEMIRKAVLSDVRIEIVETLPATNAEMTLGGADQSRAEAARRLDALGGVAATLRFSVLPDGTDS